MTQQNSRFSVIHTAFLLAVVLALFSCKKNEAPTCSFLSPVSDSFYLKADTLLVQIEAFDPDGVLSEVRVFWNDIGMVSLKNPPYNFNLYPDQLEIDRNTLKAIVYDDLGLETAAEIQVNIGQLPLVTTNPVWDINNTSAGFSGTIIKASGDTETGFYLSTESSAESTGSKIIVEPAGNKFEIHYSGLKQEEEYYVRAYCKNEFGESLGEELGFKTIIQVAPQLGIPEVKSITDTSVLARAVIYFDGNGVISAKGFCWNTSGDPTIDDTIKDLGDGIGFLESDLSELEPNTEYYIRAYATNEFGTGYGPVANFTTLVSVPNTIRENDGNTYNTVRIGN